MSETETETTATPDETETEQPQGETTEIDWKEQARKWEARAKAAKADSADAAKWREYEASQKSEHEKLAEELASLQSVASQATAKLLRYEVASEKGIPAEAIELLNGSTREELEVAADKLLSLISNQSKTVKPDLNQGKPASGGTSTADQFAAVVGDLL